MSADLTFEDAVDGYLSTHLMRSVDGGEDSGAVWFTAAAQHPELAGVLRVKDPDAVRRAPDLPRIWHYWPGLDDPGVEAALLGHGFSLLEEEPLMVRSLVHSPAGPAHPASQADTGAAVPPGLAVAAAGTDLGPWLDVWEPGLEHSVRGAVAAGLGEARRLHPERAVYLVGSRGGEPVACAAVFVAGAVAAVEHIVTSRAVRGQGIGTALTRCCLTAAAARGATSALLTASPDGAAIYRRLGFRDVGVVRRYLRP